MEPNTGTVKLILWGIVFLVVLVLGIAMWPLTVINETEKGLVLRNGALVRTLGPGMHGRMPLFESVVKMPITLSAFSAEELTYSKDAQIVTAQVTVNYRLDGANIEAVYREVQTNWESVLLTPAIKDSIKAVLAKYTAQELISNRSVLAGEIRANIQEKLSSHNILVDNVSVTNLDFDDAYEAAVSRKQVAEQDALAQAKVTAQEEEKKKQEILKAEALAEKTRLESAALASQQGEKLIAKIYAEAALELAKKWNGSVPQTYIGGGETSSDGMPPFLTFLNLNK